MGSQRYEFRVAGRVSELARTALEDMRVTEAAPETIIVGEIVDDSHLHGVLALLQNLGFQVVSMSRVPE